MRLGPLLLGGSLLLAAGSAWGASPVPSLDLRGFHPPVDPAGFLYTEPARTPGPGNWNFGAYASYALRPIRIDLPGGAANAIRPPVSLDYYGNVGIGQSWAIGVDVPTVVYQTGDDVSRTLPGSTELPHAAVGSVAVDVKRTFLSPADLGGFGLAGIGRVWIPTDSRSYVRDRGVRGELLILSELDLLAFAVRATAGFRMRSDIVTIVGSGPMDRFGHDIPWGVGISFRPQTLGLDR